MNHLTPYEDFLKRFELFIKKNKKLIDMTLSNIFTMRLIGNKTHGDLAELAISEFINQYMYDFSSRHVGKELYRAKSKEEDISIKNELTNEEISISLKAYGHGPLQLSTDKDCQAYPLLLSNGESIMDKNVIKEIFQNPVFSYFNEINTLSLIYNEKKNLCNILIFNKEKAIKETAKIILEKEGKRRAHPVYRFYNKKDQYIFEVRYGDAKANALQRGIWTHTKNASNYFYSITNGWVKYEHNLVLYKLFSLALVSSINGHKNAILKIEDDISLLKCEIGAQNEY